MPFNQEEYQKKIDLLESNGFKRGDISYPEFFTRIRTLHNFFYIKSSIPPYEVMEASYEELKEIISRIDVSNDYELNRIKKEYLKEMGRSAF